MDQRLQRKVLLTFLLTLPPIWGLSYFIFHVSTNFHLIFILNCAVLIVSFLISKYLMLNPLHNLVRNMKKLRFGKRIRLLPSDRSDELGDLAHEINLMYISLMQFREDLAENQNLIQRKVLSRTADLCKSIRKLQEDSQTDSLTGLANRGYFDKQSCVLFDNALRTNGNLACLMIDIDNFKQVNDNWGHKTGDELIEFLGKLLKAITREDDLIARYGGDEFVALLPGCSQKEVARIADRLRLHFARETHQFMRPEHKKSNPADETADSDRDTEPRLSIGIATFHDNHPLNVDHLMKMADQALYRAKEAGRNCVVTY
ncbi:MAG: diguanylate cyclase [Sedimentisphaerales bacterium]|nr:diguanylate cyclase [Sedimentisphaerales bacterium]